MWGNIYRCPMWGATTLGGVHKASSGTCQGMRSEIYYGNLATWINSLGLLRTQVILSTQLLGGTHFLEQNWRRCQAEVHFGLVEAVSCIRKFTWDKLSLLCSSLRQEMNLEVLALLPCNCWLAFMRLRREYLMAHIMGERDQDTKWSWVQCQHCPLSS